MKEFKKLNDAYMKSHPKAFDLGEIVHKIGTKKAIELLKESKGKEILVKEVPYSRFVFSYKSK